MRCAVLALVGLLFAGAAAAQSDDACRIGEGVSQPGFPLPHVTVALTEKRLDIVVLGTMSSSLYGPGASARAYPARFEAELRKRLPEIAVRVTSYAKPRQTAPDMEKEIDRILTRDKPALIIWQTGTGDAIRALDPEAFRGAIEGGVSAARAAGSDIILMNMQYSPRTETMIALTPYLDAMRFVALQNEVNLFDRFGIMKYWSENDVFDLSTVTKKTDLAERVHDCIGRLLAEFVIDANNLTHPNNKDAQ